MMRFYNQQHQFYCGVDLHAKTLHLCVLDQAGEILRHRGIRARPQDFLRTIEPYRKQLVVGTECMFAWYWLSDLCIEHLDNTFSQYNVTPPPGKFSYAANRVDLTKWFDDASVRRMVQINIHRSERRSGRKTRRLSLGDQSPRPPGIFRFAAKSKWP